MNGAWVNRVGARSRGRPEAVGHPPYHGQGNRSRLLGWRLVRWAFTSGGMVAMLLASAAGPALAQEVHPKAGKYSVTLLNVGLGPVGAALSEGLTAWQRYGDAVYWNPAAASYLAGSAGSGPTLTLSGARLLGGVRQTALQYGTSWRGFGLTLQVVYGSVGDIEVYGEEPAPEPLAIGTAHDISAGIGLGLPVLDGGGIGVAVKGIYEKLHLADAFGAAVDVGVQVPLPVWEGRLQAGMAVRNLGSMGALGQERPRLPWSMAVGVALARPLQWGEWSLDAGGDVWKPADDWAQFRLGVEAAWDVLRLRLGTRQGEGWSTVSAGIGFALSSWRLDYAYTYDPDPARQFLGGRQRLGVSLELGTRQEGGRRQ